jgi:uracil-DNA glycosylase family 4
MPLPILMVHVNKWETCQDCKIGEWTERHVFFRGPTLHRPDILFVGEAPGMTEEMVGKPFVGMAGALLDKMIERAKITDYLITNIISCRPCDIDGGPNRKPTETEAVRCRRRLSEFVEIVQPKRAVLLGKTAMEYFQRSWVKGQILELPHPSYVLRLGGHKSEEFRRCVDQLLFFLKERKPSHGR